MKLIVKALCLLLLLSCNAEKAPKKDATEAAPEATAPPPAAAKPEIWLYMTVYDGLQMREKADLKAKVVEKLPLGEFFEGTDNVSSNKVEATLGTVTWNEPFYNLTHLTPDQKSGWVFGGGIQNVYAGPRSTSPDLGKLSQFSALLRGLNPKKLDSGAKAWDYVRANFAGSKGTLADAAFAILQRFLRRMETEGEYYKMTENMPWTDADWEVIDKGEYNMTKNAQLKSIDAAGFRLVVAEGMVFPVPDMRKYLAFFGPNVTPPMKQYLEQETAEQLENEFSDGGIVIPLEKVADRAIFWEGFNKQHPYFIFKDETREHVRYRHLVLVNGADNTPSYDYETKTLSADYRKNWDYILQKYPGSDLAKHVKAVNELLTAEGGKFTPKVEAWREEFANKMTQ